VYHVLGSGSWRPKPRRVPTCKHSRQQTLAARETDNKSKNRLLDSHAPAAPCPHIRIHTKPWHHAGLEILTQRRHGLLGRRAGDGRRRLGCRGAVLVQMRPQDELHALGHLLGITSPLDLAADLSCARECLFVLHVFARVFVCTACLRASVCLYCMSSRECLFVLHVLCALMCIGIVCVRMTASLQAH
jgi:hypothetical protein